MRPATCDCEGTCSELRYELPGQRWNEGLQAVFPDLGPVIHARRGVRAVERTHLDWIPRHAPLEVVADVFLAAHGRGRNARGDRTAIGFGVCHDAALPATRCGSPYTRTIAHAS